MNSQASQEPLAQADLFAAFDALSHELRQRIIGQDRLLQRLLIALLADGHLLVEGAPGLAKTTAIKELAVRLEGDFHRLQFTPDLLPSDLTGTDIYRPQTGTFEYQHGPIFHNLILADEINRAPAKVQSALLEAMGEHQVTVGQKSYPLQRPFLVMATQNPIEQEGTYPLPEAQLDRFLMHVKVDYPDAGSEERILDLAMAQAQNDYLQPAAPQSLLSNAQVLQAQQAILGLHMAAPVKNYIVQLVIASRAPAKYSADLARWIEYGASPRGTIALARCARAHAWLMQRDYVSPEDVQAVVGDVLRHRILLRYEAEADGVSSDDVIQSLLRCVPVS